MFVLIMLLLFQSFHYLCISSAGSIFNYHIGAIKLLKHDAKTVNVACYTQSYNNLTFSQSFNQSNNQLVKLNQSFSQVINQSIYLLIRKWNKKQDYLEYMQTF